MNGSGQMEVHYINTGFPYTVTESFMDLFEGLAYAQADFAFAGHLQNQDYAYWPMQTNAYKYGPNSGSTSHYGHTNGYEVCDHLMRMDGGRRMWESPSRITYEEPPSLIQESGTATMISQASSQECVRSHQDTNSSQVLWQDNIDPDNMTYEELLDLGEAVGTQNRGLSPELISRLPVSKHKCSFFSRKKKRSERCVICQMDFKRGERQMTLPCKHIYHVSCVTRWLNINKACPICYVEVFGEEPRR